MQPLKEFATVSPAENSLSRRPRHQLANCSPVIASESARMILGCYRKGEAEDADIYVRALVAILSSYPEVVVRRVSDPRIGIAGRSKFLPTISEVRQDCETEMAPVYAEIRAEIRAEERRREREAPDFDRTGRKSFEELRAAYPDIVGQSQVQAKRAYTEEEKSAELSRLYSRKPEFEKPTKLSPAALAIFDEG